MFGKIKDKLKSVFEKTEEVVGDEEEHIEETKVEEKKVEETPTKEDKKESKKKEESYKEGSEEHEEEPKEEKKGFLSRVFGKKEEEEHIEEPTEEETKEEIKEEKVEDDLEELEKEIEEKPQKKKTKKEDIDETLEKIEEGDTEELIEVDTEEKKETPINVEKELDEKPKEEVKEPEKTEENSEEHEEEPKEEKKGFLSRVFGKKEEKEEVEEVPEEEKIHLEPLKVEKEKDKIQGDKIDKKPKEEEEPTEEDLEEKVEKKEGFLSKTFSKLKKKEITEDDFEKIWVELEIFLLEINIAYEIVEKIQEKLKETLIGNSFDRFNLVEKIREVLEEEVEEVLKGREADFIVDLQKNRDEGEPAKILILGVNGTGKTTTIAKIVKYLRDNGLSVVVAAADTFRAAAVEQLEEHSKKLEFKLIRHKGGSDPAAVAFDAIEHAKSKNIDVVLIDTAGRMPNNSNLMTELQKIKKVSNSKLAIFIGDSISGNDLVDQIELFDKGVDINGVVLTKVDTDEKPGSIVTTAYAIEKPIYFLGSGQNYEDLVKFNAKLIARQLFDPDEESDE